MRTAGRLALGLCLAWPALAAAWNPKPAVPGFPVNLGRQPVEYSSVLPLKAGQWTYLLVGDKSGSLWRVALRGPGQQPLVRSASLSGPISSSPSTAPALRDRGVPEARAGTFFLGDGADIRNWNPGSALKVDLFGLTTLWRQWGRDISDGVERWTGVQDLQPQGNGVADGVFGSLVIADLDNDGNFEVVFGGWDHHIYVRQAGDGSLAGSGWPIDTLDSVWSTPAVGDVDGDGFKEIFTGSDLSRSDEHAWSFNGGRMWGLDRRGNILPGWPRRSAQTFYSSPAVGDINNDGRYEIVCGTGTCWRTDGRGAEATGPFTGRHVFGWRLDGTALPGWPVEVGGAVFSSPALADLDGDRRLETIVGATDGRIYCLNADGSIRWRTLLVDRDGRSYETLRDRRGWVLGSPVVADIDGDGDLEVLVCWSFEVVILDHLGRLLTGANSAGRTVYLTFQSLFSSPSVADINGDNLLEIVVAGGRRDGGGALYAWPTTAPAGSARPWWTFHRDEARTGFVPRD